MNILVTLDAGYLGPLSVMLRSLLESHPQQSFDIYVMNSGLTEENFKSVRQKVESYHGLKSGRMQLIDVKVDRAMLQDAPITDRYPQEMYYRIFAARFLPETLDRVLYLDPDMVVINPLNELYEMELGNAWFAAASHVRGVMEKLNEIRLQSEEPGPYINSGVMLMNLKQLRENQDESQVMEYIEKHRNLLMLPDQDVISALYGGKILRIDPYRYNMTERLLMAQFASREPVDVAWVRRNTSIVHYCGRNKPWKERYVGKLDCFYRYYAPEQVQPEEKPFTRDLAMAALGAAVDKGLRNVEDDPHSIDGLLDLGLVLAKGPAQGEFIKQVQELLQDDNSPYYSMIANLVRRTDREFLKTFGINLGYNSWTSGVHQLRENQWSNGVGISWLCRMQVSQETEKRLRGRILQGKDLGVFSYALDLRGVANDKCNQLFSVIAENDDCTFLLFVEGDQVNEAFAAGLLRVKCAAALIFLPRQPGVASRQSVTSAVERLARKRCLFGFCAVYGEDTLARVLSEEDMAWAEYGSPFLLYAAEPGTARDIVAEAANRVLQARLHPEHSVFPIELSTDVRYVDHIIRME